MAMENSYRPLQNMHALKALIKPQSIPAVDLAIGEDETHASQPVLVFTDAYANMFKVANVEDSGKRPIENIGVAGDGLVISENDLISGDMFLGSAIEVF